MIAGHCFFEDIGRLFDAGERRHGQVLHLLLIGPSYPSMLSTDRNFFHQHTSWPWPSAIFSIPFALASSTVFSGTG